MTCQELLSWYVHWAACCVRVACDAQTDKDILEHIVYDFGDVDMMEALRPSIEEAQPVQSQELALDYIGTCGVLCCAQTKSYEQLCDSTRRSSRSLHWTT